MPKKDPKLVNLAKSLGELYSINKEDIFSSDITVIDYLSAQFDSFTDNRQQWKITYRFSDVVMIVVLCCFARIDEWKEMYLFAKHNEESFRKLLKMETPIPSHDTLEDVISIIKPQELINMLVPLFVKVVDNGLKILNIENEPIYKDNETTITDIIAFDGKVINKSGQKYKQGEESCNYNSLNVFSTEYRISLWQERIASKTNEITAMPKVIKLLKLSGTIATFDALNTQKDIINEIVESKGDYVAVLKKNHGTFYSELEDYFNDEDLLNKVKNTNDSYLEEITKTKRETIKRSYYITSDINWFHDKDLWRKLTSFGYEYKTIQNNDTGEIVTEKRYFLNSIKPNINLFSLAVRRHWNIENCLHWHLDVTFREDNSKTKNKNVLENMSIIRRFVLAILGLVKETYPNYSLKSIRSEVSWGFESSMKKIFSALSFLAKEDK